jgi:hypothetical protein
MKYLPMVLLLSLSCICCANVIVWVDGVAWRTDPLVPLPPQGFFHDPNWNEEWNTYFDTYTHDGLQTSDPNIANHYLEVQLPNDDDPNGHVWIGYLRTNDIELDGTGKTNQAVVEQEPISEKIFGGVNQHYDPSIPPQWQKYSGGTVFVYTDIELIDFMECWLYDFPPFDFNKDNIINMVDLIIFIREFLG